MIMMLATALAPMAFKFGLGFAGIAGMGFVGNSFSHMRQGLYTLFYKGPECVVDIVGADLNKDANNMFDKFTRPDIKVECRHGKHQRSTPVEFNEYNPRFYFSSKMPYSSGQGFVFTVYEHDITRGDQAMGRAFVDAQTAKKYINYETTNNGKAAPPLTLSLGHGIGELKVRLRRPSILLNSVL